MDIQELKSNLSDLENRLQDIKENVLLVDLQNSKTRIKLKAICQRKRFGQT
jgi:hypothetical protein